MKNLCSSSTLNILQCFEVLHIIYNINYVLQFLTSHFIKKKNVTKQNVSRLTMIFSRKYNIYIYSKKNQVL